MFGIRKKTDPEMEDLIRTLRNDMGNNYKDAAQEDFRALDKRFEERQQEGSLTEKQLDYYLPVLKDLQQELKGFTHKDQPARWDPKV